MNTQGSSFRDLTRSRWSKPGGASLLALSVALLAGCGGGESTTSASTSGTFTLSGTVPGTRIEVYGDNGSFYTTSSTNNGTAQHPYSIELPTNMGLRLVLVTSEEDPNQRMVSPIGFDDGLGGTTTVFQSGSPGTVDLGYIDLPLTRSDAGVVDANADGVADKPLQVPKPEGLKAYSMASYAAAGTLDKDGDGIINVYDHDVDGDGIDNQSDADYTKTGDSDGDGVPNEVDANPTNSSSSDNTLPGAIDSNGDGYADNDTNHDGIPDTGAGAGTAGYSLMAWNDLGMHCMDSDYSVFSILPPFNTINAQLVHNGDLVSSGVELTYAATQDLKGSINTDSVSKTNFWTHAKALFGVDLADNIGLTGNPAPTTSPSPMAFNSAENWFEATGVPLTPIDDAGKTNAYPMQEIVARDAAGNVLASAKIVTPVSTEMNCAACHASNAALNFSADAEPQAGWVNDPDPEKDYRRNILRLHDEKEGGSSKFTDALAAQAYDPAGLLATADGGKPVLCASCHGSNALPGTGLAGIPPLTQVIHSKHANVQEPTSGTPLNQIASRDACYLCHPGTDTQCLRGAMGSPKDAQGHNKIECQSCHGNLSAVGSVAREGWLDEPTCQACHADGQRALDAHDAAGNLKEPADQRFATQLNRPLAGKRLYRFSEGHGGLQCSACHGSTHAIFPTDKANDNAYSNKLQGHAGTIAECTTCHEQTPKTSTQGPHGMHTVGAWWVDEHGDVAEDNVQACASCHGADFRGSPLSEVTASRAYNTEFGNKVFPTGHQISCYDCHSGPNFSGD